MNYKNKRLALKLTQIEVAKRIGISLTAYQNIENGVTKNPKADTIKQLKLIFGE